MDGWMDGWTAQQNTQTPISKTLFLSLAPFLSTVIRVFVGGGAGVANIHTASISEIVNST
jgi:hypothetical protein